MVYPRGLCCEEPNPKAEWVEVCNRVRLSSLLDREPMIPMIEIAQEFFEALLNPRRIRLLDCSPSRTICLVRLDGVEHNILVYRKRGFWSLGYSYAAKIAAEKWCEKMYREVQVLPRSSNHCRDPRGLRALPEADAPGDHDTRPRLGQEGSAPLHQVKLPSLIFHPQFLKVYPPSSFCR